MPGPRILEASAGDEECWMQEQASVQTSEEERSTSPTTPTLENPLHPLDPTATDLGGSEAGGGSPRRISEVGATWRGRARVGGAARRCCVQLRLRACAGEGCHGGVTISYRRFLGPSSISYRRFLGPSSRWSPSCAAVGVSLEGGEGRKEK